MVLSLGAQVSDTALSVWACREAECATKGVTQSDIVCENQRVILCNPVMLVTV